MDSKNEVTKQILEAGKQEFLSKGFYQASLRTIVKKTGMTTGAFYRYFSNKEALFDALVSSEVNELLNFFEIYRINWLKLTLSQQVQELNDASDGIHWVVDYIYSHFDAFRLILSCSEGTKYANFLERITAIEVESVRYFIQLIKQAGCNIQDYDTEFLSMLIYAFFCGMFQIVTHNISKEKAFEYIEQLRNFYSAGYFNLLGIEHLL